MANDQSYRFVPVALSQSDNVAVVELFQHSFGNTNLTSEILDWQYAKNPNGSAVGFNAFAGEQLAAHYVTIPIKAWRSGKLSNGLLSINTATHPMHQKRGLFTQLAELTYTRARALGFEFVVGVANQNSVHGFVKKLNFQHVSELERRLVLSPISKGDARELEFVCAWDSNSIAWRTAHPERNYKIRRHGAVSHILGNSARFSALVAQVDSSDLPNGMAAGGRALRQWIGLDCQIDWRRNFNVRIPSRYHPIPLNLIFRDLIGAQTIDPARVKFWAMDFDAY